MLLWEAFDACFLPETDRREGRNNVSCHKCFCGKLSTHVFCLKQTDEKEETLFLATNAFAVSFRRMFFV